MVGAGLQALEYLLWVPAAVCMITGISKQHLMLLHFQEDFHPVHLGHHAVEHYPQKIAPALCSQEFPRVNAI